VLRDRLVSDTDTSIDAAKRTDVNVGLGLSAGVSVESPWILRGFSVELSLLLTTSLFGWLQVEPCWCDTLERRMTR
jgi:hypothetical protein